MTGENREENPKRKGGGRRGKGLNFKINLDTPTYGGSRIRVYPGFLKGSLTEKVFL